MPGASRNKRVKRETPRPGRRKNAEAAVKLISSEISDQLTASEPVIVEAGFRKLEAFGRELLRGKLGRTVTSILRERKGAPKWNRQRCFSAVAKVGSSRYTSAALLSALSDPEPMIRDFACEALGKGRIRSAEAALFRRTNDEDDQVRYRAYEALSQIGVELSESAMRRGLRDASPLPRLAVTSAIGEQWRNGKVDENRARTVLREHLGREDDPLVRSEALVALYEIEANDSDLLDLLSLAKRKEGLVRWRVYDCLERIANSTNSQRIVDVLKRLLPGETSAAKRHLREVMRSIASVARH